jgi:hypothetical protein
MLRSVNATGRGKGQRAPSPTSVTNMDVVAIILVVALLLVGAGVAYFLSQHETEPLRPVPNAGQSDIERDFARVFSMTSAQGKERLIKRWMDRAGCDRREAMRLATEEWRRENR